MEYLQANSRRDAEFIAAAGELFCLDVVTIQEELTKDANDTVRLSGKWHVWLQGQKRSCAVYKGEKFNSISKLATALREDAVEEANP